MSSIIPYLICDKFQSNLYLEFENIDINVSSTKLFRLQNPYTKSSINIAYIKKLSNEQKGFNITFDNNQLSDHAIIAPSSEVIGQVTWTPKQNMSVREIITLKIDDKISLQIIVSGKCGDQVYLRLNCFTYLTSSQLIRILISIFMLTHTGELSDYSTR